ncbi:MAG TPA: hypothetical protein PK467_19225, partial [Candidatus Wallbacteria bacterium]|nr:hypothetical protein [Candidatus Wallbacteria bacterium]
MKRVEKYLKMPYRRFDKPGRRLPDAPRYAGTNASGRAALSVKRLKSFLFLFLIVFTMLFASYIPAEAYYLDAINPSGSKWVTSNPYSFTWNNNVGYWTPAWWGGSNASYYYTLITIYNSGYKNNDSVVYGSSYSRTLNETPMNQSYWRARGYYSYRYDYLTYWVEWVPYWGWYVWCSWWSK